MMGSIKGEANPHAVSVRVEYRTALRAAGQARHDLRTGRVPGYVASERSDLNTVIVRPATPASLRAECEHRRAHRPHRRRMRKDAAVAIVGVLSFGRQAQKLLEPLSPEEQDSLALRAAQAVADAMNTTLTGLVGHRDEAGLHWHLQMPAYATDGRCLSHERPQGLYSRLQDRVSDVYAPLGIERGYAKHQRLAAGAVRADLIHKQVHELHVLLPAQIAVAEASLERNRQLLAQTETSIEARRGNLAKLKMRAEHYERRIAKAESVLAELPVPRAVRLERVVGRTKRPLRSDAVETQIVRVYPLKPVQRIVKSLAERTAAAEQRAEQATKEAGDARDRANAEAQERMRQDAALRVAGRTLYDAGLPRPDNPNLQPGYDAAAWDAEHPHEELDDEPQEKTQHVATRERD